MDDIDRVLDLWVDLARGQRHHGSHLDPDDSRDAIRLVLARRISDGDLLVAREEGATVGFLAFEFEAGSFEQSVDRGIVQYVYVEPEHRGRGVGSALFDAAESAMIDAGADAIALEVMADNGAARRFYRRRGYRPHRVEYERRVDEDG